MIARGALALALVACGATSERVDDGGPDDTGHAGGAEIAEPCEDGADCVSGVCWDYAEHDEMCGGKACSSPCSTSDACRDLATEAGAATPLNATCGADDQCNFVGTGLGEWVCE